MRSQGHPSSDLRGLDTLLAACELRMGLQSFNAALPGSQEVHQSCRLQAVGIAHNSCKVPDQHVPLLVQHFWPCPLQHCCTACLACLHMLSSRCWQQAIQGLQAMHTSISHSYERAAVTGNAHTNQCAAGSQGREAGSRCISGLVGSSRG